MEGPGPRADLRAGPADPAHHLRAAGLLRAQDPEVAPGRGPPRDAPAPPGAPPGRAGPQAIGLPVLAGPRLGGGGRERRTPQPRHLVLSVAAVPQALGPP